ncbi:sarcospan S homeolog [Xenopus laevis]|uniref:LOC495447 protein n=2 Tax=Xenopus laevis TaxID=8355 RepID=Q5U4S5_XENLA|nr:sarcospan S homeolog [Xenopus laevis]AAH84969.1 LOC495447 protein [Xenopus laevis]OCT86022.1 hypothetical protein XELAEV_18019716mg [Xenopus laevis]
MAAGKDKGNESAPEPKKEAKVGREESHNCCGCRFPLLIALLQLSLGVSVTVLSFIMAASCPSLLPRDTPYWAGICVSAVAVLGLILLCLPYQPDEKTMCQFVLKLLYFLLSALGLIICVTAVAFAAYHHSYITKFTCHMATDWCQCTMDSSDPLSRTFQYQNVSDCDSITGTMKLFVLLQMALNLLLALVCLASCFVMWKDRYQVFYVGQWFPGPAPNVARQQKV